LTKNFTSFLDDGNTTLLAANVELLPDNGHTIHLDNSPHLGDADDKVKNRLIYPNIRRRSPWLSGHGIRPRNWGTGLISWPQTLRQHLTPGCPKQQIFPA